MSFTTSPRESRLWLYTTLVLLTIFSTLFLGRPLLEVLSDQNVQAVFFLTGMLLVGAAILMYGFRAQPGKVEASVWVGFAAIYLMLFLRLGLAERSHLIEYSILAIFIDKALVERKYQGRQVPLPGLLAFAMTFAVGIIDECIQLFLPERVFDPADIVFNGLAALLAIGSTRAIRWVRKKAGGTESK